MLWNSYLFDSEARSLVRSRVDVDRVRLGLFGDLHSGCCPHTGAAACHPHNEPHSEDQTADPWLPRGRAQPHGSGRQGRQASSSRSPPTTARAPSLQASTGPNSAIYLSKYVPIPFLFSVVIPCELCCGPQPVRKPSISQWRPQRSTNRSLRRKGRGKTSHHRRRTLSRTSSSRRSYRHSLTAARRRYNSQKALPQL